MNQRTRHAFGFQSSAGCCLVTAAVPFHPASPSDRNLYRPFIALSLALVLSPILGAGWSFDAGYEPEPLRDLLIQAGLTSAPENSWLRLRGMERSAVLSADGKDESPWRGVTPTVTIAERRQALSELRQAGYRLVGFLRWSSQSWAGGVRSDQPLRRTPLDLREAYERSRRLAETYGDLIDYWEIENEPDISFVEENPETYAAFLKACHLGILAGGGKEAAGSRVLMAPLALPPGPYFQAFVANDGMRHTDGFNYHYYGYAEDFTGVYLQFRDAVQRVAGSPVAGAGESIFSTRFLPVPADWKPQVQRQFNHSAELSAENRLRLQQLPLARDEPRLVEDGRWLVSPGMHVEETPEGWRFHVSAPAPGPLRPAMAELPLPSGWTLNPEYQLAFEHRLAPAPDLAGVTPSAVPTALPATPQQPLAAFGYDEGNSNDLPAPSLRPDSVIRQLPVFLTEYGYGLLSKDSRSTAEGREQQRAWFEAVTPQIQRLGIEGAMAFLLRPYIERGHNEFGLLMTAETAPSGPQSVSPWGALQASPALDWLLQPEGMPLDARSWPIFTAAPTPVVIDFVAGPGLIMAKSYRGHLLQGSDAEGHLILYNLGAHIVTGELDLEGSAWSLDGDLRRQRISLAPGSRTMVPVRIHPRSDRFSAHAAQARFRVLETGTPAPTKEQPVAAPVAANAPSSTGLPKTPPVQSTAPAARSADFESYLRTRNGNLFQTWPRLQARDEWQWYNEQLANFTVAFFGRAHLPWSLAENEPAALVFFFRPNEFPAVYEIRHAQITE